MKKLFGCLVVICSFIEGCLGIQNCILVNLNTVYKNTPFTGDFVHSIYSAEQEAPFRIINIFRIDNSNANPDGKADRDTLNTACMQFPLKEFVIFHNKSHVGCSKTRQMLLATDLRWLIEEDLNIRQAASEGKLFFQFLDTDDIVHFRLFHIELAVMTSNNDCYVLNCERCIRKFGRYSVERLEGMHCDCSLIDFSLGKRTERNEEGAPFLPDGTMSRKRKTTSIFGYIPTCFKYEEARFFPEVSYEHFLIETMHSLSDLRGDGVFLLFPNVNVPPLYYYRQHSASALHSTKGLVRAEGFENMLEDPSLIRIYVSILIDCDLDVFKVEFEKLKKKMPPTPGLGELMNDILAKVAGKREKLKVSSLLAQKMNVTTETTYISGLSW